MGYRHFTIEERESILSFLSQGITQTEMAKNLNRNKGSISRELRRNVIYGKYSPSFAQNMYAERKSNIKIAVVVGILVLIVFGIAGVDKYIEYQGYVSAKKSKDISNMSSFVKKYPNSEYKKEIMGLITKLRLEKIKMGKYEVTQAEYRAVMGYNPSYFKGDNLLYINKIDGLYFKGDNLPVESVTWYDAVMYCNKLSEKEKLPKYYSITNIEKDGDNITEAEVTIIGGQGYKLPTNEEWEYAAKGGLKTHGYAYAGSNNIDEVAWNGKNSGDRTHPVGQTKPNELGLYDMSGNVLEWTETRGEGSSRCNRGGSWGLNDVSCQIDFQFSDYAGDSRNDLGFRVCRVVS